jgi:hypothetical protein
MQTRRFGIWGDDRMGYGKPEPRKKCRLDVEWAGSELRVPPNKGVRDHIYA